VASVSHELRTPLAVIRSAADNLADGVVTEKQQVHEYGTLISGHARRLNEIVDQVLMFAARKAGRISYELRPVRINEVVEAVLQDTASLIAASGFTLEKTLPRGLPEVLADPEGLKHCLQNLISNALKYGGDQRWLGVRVERSGSHGGTEVRVTVEDKGPGIAKEEQARIFDPFFRGVSAVARQIRGTGLGLSLAMDIAEAMGGRLTVRSEPGQGSAFTLHLRTAPDAAPATDFSTQDLAEVIPSQASGTAPISPGMEVKDGGRA
jgi:signal transduction histidine kinase